MFHYKLRTLLIVLALGPPIVAAVISSRWGRRVVTPRLRVENFTQLKIGMSQAQVEKLLGGAPGNYGQYSENSGFMTLERYPSPPGSIERVWFDDANRFELYFDAQSGQLVGQHERARYSQSPATH